MQHPAEGAPEQPVLLRLRSLVCSCLDKSLLPSAVFFADKLVSASGGAPEDVFLLARALLLAGQAPRALALLRAESLATAGPRFLLLTAQCLVAERQWEDALALLGDVGSEAEHAMGGGCARAACPPCRLRARRRRQPAGGTPRPTPSPPAASLPPALSLSPTCSHPPAPSRPPALPSMDAPPGGGVATAAALSLLRGRVHAALENRAAARQCYLAALRSDARCHEAFDALVGGHLVGGAEAEALVASLAWAPQDAWLGPLYGLQACATQPGARPDERTAQMVASAARCGLGEAGAAALGANGDCAAARAGAALAAGDAPAAYAATHALLQRDGARPSALPVHLAAAAALGKRNELFARAHSLVASRPSSGLAWYAVGVYYAAAGQPGHCRRVLAKAVALDPGLAPAWLAYGHAFAAAEEADAALAAYRTAGRLFPGLHQPLLWAGVEYARAAQNWGLARHVLLAARDAAPHDPAPHHELGCVALRCGQPQEAAAHFGDGLRAAAPRRLGPQHAPLLLGHAAACRKLRRFAEAARLLGRCLGLCPGDPAALGALAYTRHLAGDVHAAVDGYHAALAARPEDGFCQEMLARALADAADAPLGLLDPDDMSP